MTPLPQALAAAAAVLAREGSCLDGRRFDDWLALYAPDCVYWVPTWTSFETLAADPQTELSHIYYASRAGLEDRIVRVRTGTSPASTPAPRTTHVLGPVVPRGAATADRIAVEVAWSTHVYYPAAQEQHTFFGNSEVDLVLRDGRWLIARKKIILQNDYVPVMVDVYCL